MRESHAGHAPTRTGILTGAEAFEPWGYFRKRNSRSWQNGSDGIT